MLGETDVAGLVGWLGRHPVTFAHGWRQSLYAGHYCPAHQHDCIEIVFHKSGGGWTTLGMDDRILYSHDDVVIYGRQQRHDQSVEVEGLDACIQFNLHSSAPTGFDACRVGAIEDRCVQEELMCMAQTLPLRSPAERLSADLRATALLARLLELTRPVGPATEVARAERQVERVRAYIRSHYATIGNVEEVAAFADISYHHLRHVFADVCGISLRQYLIDVRIDAAKRLLAHSPLSQKTIAEMCGFANERYFSTCFRQRVGVTAGEFRDKQQQPALAPVE